VDFYGELAMKRVMKYGMIHGSLLVLLGDSYHQEDWGGGVVYVKVNEYRKHILYREMAP
jgi:hypothetical protein